MLFPHLQTERNAVHCITMCSGHDGYSILPLKEKDAGDLARLEAACFSTAWPEERYRIVLRAVEDAWQALWPEGTALSAPARSGPAGEEKTPPVPAFLVLGARDHTGALSGYISLGLSPAAGEAEVYNIAVHETCRRCGMGKALLERARRLLSALGMERIFLEVREGNAPALALYVSAGFAPCGRRTKYYADTGEDALVLVKEPEQEDAHHATAHGRELEDV